MCLASSGRRGSVCSAGASPGLQNRWAAWRQVAGGFDSHALPPFPTRLRITSHRCVSPSAPVETRRPRVVRTSRRGRPTIERGSNSDPTSARSCPWIREMTDPTCMVRPCRPDDADALVNLVRELAVYEKLEHHARATADDFRSAPVRDQARRGGVRGRGRRPGGGLRADLRHVLDVPRAARDVSRRPLRATGVPGDGDRQGLAGDARTAGGRARLRAARMGGARLECPVDRLLPGSLGALPMDEWTVYRLCDEPLSRLAALAPSLAQESPRG